MAGNVFHSDHSSSQRVPRASRNPASENYKGNVLGKGRILAETLEKVDLNYYKICATWTLALILANHGIDHPRLKDLIVRTVA